MVFLTAARAKARKVAEAIEQGRKDILGLKDDDLLAFNRAKQSLAGREHVDVAVTQWMQAVTALGGKAILMDAVRYFLSNGGPDLTPKKVKDAVTELLALKKA